MDICYRVYTDRRRNIPQLARLGDGDNINHRSRNINGTRVTKIDNLGKSALAWNRYLFSRFGEGDSRIAPAYCAQHSLSRLLVYLIFIIKDFNPYLLENALNASRRSDISSLDNVRPPPKCKAVHTHFHAAHYTISPQEPPQCLFFLF